MYLQNVISFAITLPMAMYYGYHKGNDLSLTYIVSINKTVDNKVDEENLSFCNCTNPSRFSELVLGTDITSKLIEIDIPEKSIDGIINMLNTLEWKEEETDEYIALASASNLIVDFFQKVLKILHRRALLFWFISIMALLHILCLRVLLQKTILGVLLKVNMRHLRCFIFHNILHSFSTTMARYVSSCSAESRKADLSRCSLCEEKSSLECALKKLKGIYKLSECRISEETLPMGSQPEEQNRRVSSDCKDGSQQHRQLNSTYHDDYESNCTTNTDNSIPEKFKQFLHDKYEAVDKLGMSFIEDDYIEDGASFREVKCQMNITSITSGHTPSH